MIAAMPLHLTPFLRGVVFIDDGNKLHNGTRY
jgi:hypothetical protein